MIDGQTTQKIIMERPFRGHWSRLSGDAFNFKAKWFYLEGLKYVFENCSKLPI